MTDPAHHRSARDRLESALVRVVAAVDRLQHQRTVAQARYDMLDRTGSEMMVMIDALLKGSDQPQVPAETAAPRLGPALAETADAA